MDFGELRRLEWMYCVKSTTQMLALEKRIDQQNDLHAARSLLFGYLSLVPSLCSSSWTGLPRVKAARATRRLNERGGRGGTLTEPRGCMNLGPRILRLEICNLLQQNTTVPGLAELRISAGTRLVTDAMRRLTARTNKQGLSGLSLVLDLDAYPSRCNPFS